MGWPASTCFNLHQPASASGQGDAEPLSFVHPVQWLWILDGTLVIHCLFPHKYVGGTNKRNKRNATKRNLTCQTIGVSSCFIPGEVHTGFAWTWRRFILMSCDKLETRNISSYPSVSRSKCNCRHFRGIECKVSTIYEWGISKALSNCMCLNLFCWMFAHHTHKSLRWATFCVTSQWFVWYLLKSAMGPWRDAFWKKRSIRPCWESMFNVVKYHQESFIA